MALHERDRNNFDTLMAAAENGNLCLLECTDAKTNKYVAVLAAIEEHPQVEGDYLLTPLARMFEDPFNELNPPEGAIVEDALSRYLEE